jgi:FkbM family methyltransferase
MKLMNLVFLRHVLPRSIRQDLRARWDLMLRREAVGVEQRFYRSVVKEKDLVFDVGANIGLKTNAFLDLGARVIAIEPNPVCADIIRINSSKLPAAQNLVVVPCAIGASRGRLVLNLFEGANTISSGSDEFTAAALAAGQKSSGAIEVEKTTLDDLISRFGMPDFIKIDVEGMDAEVMQGLSKRPKLLSFEYNLNPGVWPNTLRCISEAKRLGFTEANITTSSESNLIFKTWINLSDLDSAIRSALPSGNEYGDVFVR